MLKKESKKCLINVFHNFSTYLSTKRGRFNNKNQSFPQYLKKFYTLHFIVIHTIVNCGGKNLVLKKKDNHAKIFNMIGDRMILQIIILLAGFFLLIKGASFFVDGASNTARHFNLSKIIIGLTIVAFGTSAPEFAVSFKSILIGNHDIVLGNVIGSNVANILLILGSCALFRPLKINKENTKVELPFVLLLTILFSVLISDSIFNHVGINNFTRIDGLFIFLAFVIFIIYLFTVSINKENRKEKESPTITLKKAIIFTVLGIVMIILGSEFVVRGATSIAKIIGVSDKIIALTIIALGTSLPELVTSIIATKKGEIDLVIGNVVGSNIFNLGLVLGLPVLLFGGSPNVNFDYIDIIVLLLSTALLYVFASNDRKISKKEGIILLSIFIIYYTYIVIIGL